MAEVVVSIVLETFRDLVFEEARFLCGVSGQVTQLQKELERLESFLKDADSKQHADAQIRTFVRQIRDLAYKAEDVLETYFIEVKSKRELSVGESKIKKLLKRFACFLNEGINIHKVGREIDDIKTDLAELRGSLNASGINPISKEEKSKEKAEKQRLLRQTFPREDKDFVGMVDEIMELVSLVKDVNDHKVISIWGMGGSGKTTMAKKIYNHPDVKQEFDAFAWVCISQNCDLNAALKDLVKQLTNTEAHGTSSSELMRSLTVALEEKKCLVVLDDVWEVEDWEYFSRVLPDVEGQSKMLVTTRIVQVAMVGFVHKQRLLTEKEALMLLHKKALPQHRPNDPQLEKYFAEFGKEIINKCGKLPLAIAILGGIMRNRVSLKDWKKIHSDIDSTLNQDLGNLGEDGTISKVLSLSYYDLPHFLKPCFLYLSVFKEDESIDPKTVYHLWIAEGLISKRYCLKGETLMDVADRFLKALISRSMVQVEVDDPILENFWWLRVHDMMRELCLRRAKEEYFLETLTDKARPSVIGDAPRYLIHMPLDDAEEERCIDPLEPIKSSYVRALSFEMVVSNKWSGKKRTVKASVENFEFLRVLNFKFCWFHEKELLRRMGRLIHLRYLSLFRCDVKELPSCVGDLPLLETLDLRTMSVILIPHDIFSKKSALMHHYLSLFTCGPGRKLHLNGLGKLETFISNNSSRNNPIELMELSELTNIRVFEMSFGNENDDQGALIIDKMKSWKTIKTLELNMSRVGEQLAKAALMSTHVTRLNFKKVDISTLPKYEAPFGQNLERFSMMFCLGLHREMIFEWLGKLPKLTKFTYFSYLACPNKVVKFDDNNFLRLKSLIIGWRDLKEMIIGKGSLPNLIELKLDGCDKFKIVPEDGLKYLDNLKELRLVDRMLSLKSMCQMHHSQYPHLKILYFGRTSPVII